MDLLGKRVLVVGLARTGVALARFLVEKGARVTVTDQAEAEELGERLGEINGLPVSLLLGGSYPGRVKDYELILLSPGVPPEVEWLSAARAEGVPVWGELELAGHFIKRPVIAVTGTNGKTTTTTLVGEMLAASGLRPLVGGNIGRPAIELVAQQEQADYVVLEVSSFQLDTAVHFHPQEAALLNITPDHLDRYPSYQAYIASKAGVFRCQEEHELKVLNADDPVVSSLGRGRGRVYYFSAQRSLSEGAWLQGQGIRVRLASGWEGIFSLRDIWLKEEHNLENVMAALLLALEAGAEAEACRQVLRGFRGLPHRLQWVAAIDGVDYYDDSKGTNVGAVSRSLGHFQRPVVLIAGGRDKDSDFSLLSPLVREKVKALVLLGETKEQLARLWGELAPAYVVEDMGAAVKQARRLARPGEAVLLSPGCASFDMFRDYAQRGETFQRLVREEADDDGH